MCLFVVLSSSPLNLGRSFRYSWGMTPRGWSRSRGAYLFSKKPIRVISINGGGIRICLRNLGQDHSGWSGSRVCQGLKSKSWVVSNSGLRVGCGGYKGKWNSSTSRGGGVFSFQIFLKINFSRSDINGAFCWDVSEWVWGLLKARVMNDNEGSVESPRWCECNQNRLLSPIQRVLNLSCPRGKILQYILVNGTKSCCSS